MKSFPLFLEPAKALEGYSIDYLKNLRPHPFWHIRDIFRIAYNDRRHNLAIIRHSDKFQQLRILNVFAQSDPTGA